jgi:hypothetical protein
MNSGSGASLFAAKRSPRTLTSASSPQRASATCSSSDTSRRSGQTRRTDAARTHGTCSRPARSAPTSTEKKLPARWLRIAASMAARGARSGAARSSTLRSAKSGELAAR